MFCTSCGVKNAADSLFCKRCGHKLESDSAGTTAVSPDYSPLAPNDRASGSTGASYATDDFPVDEQISALLERAYQQRQKGSPNAAVALCRDALRLRPESTSAHSLLGQLFEAAGDYTGAVSEYERVLEINPGSVADRVKLEELRGKSSALPLRPDRTSGIRFSEDGGYGRSYRMLAAVGGGAALMMLGGILALLFSQRSGSVIQDAANPSRANQTTASGIPGGAPLQNTPQQSGSQTLNAGIASANSSPGAEGANPSAFISPFGPAPMIYTAPPLVRTLDPRSHTPRQHDIPLTSVKSLATTKIPATPDENRVVLEDKHEDKDVIDRGGGSVTIRVPGENKQGSNTGAKSHSDAPGKDDHVIVEKDPRNGGASTSSAASAESLTQVLAGDERKRQKDFVGAIKAYSTALRSAGDDAGYIRQQIGRCYALHGDNTSAVSSYERAIADYDRLIAAGRQVEQAQNGKRVCEKAIKSCSN